MNNSQTSDQPDPQKPADNRDPGERDSDSGYYYDDTTGYEVYDDGENQSDEEEESPPDKTQSG